MAWWRKGKPSCAFPCFTGVLPNLPLKQHHCWAGWTRPFPAMEAKCPPVAFSIPLCFWWSVLWKFGSKKKKRKKERKNKVAQISQHASCLAVFSLIFGYGSHVSQVYLLVGCLTSQQHACVSQGRICSDNFTCCHTEIEVADQTFHLTQSQYTDTGLTSPSAGPIAPDTWQGSHWSANF